MTGQKNRRSFDPASRCMKIEDWPAADRAAWQAAREPGDVLDPEGLAADWRPATVRKNMSGYGRWLTWLDLCGVLDRDAEPAGRVTPERIAAYVGDLQARNAPNTVIARLAELRNMLRVMTPDRDWSWIGKIESKVRRGAQPVRDKQARLQPVRAISALGLRLIAEAEAGGGAALATALGVRDGLMLALWAARPLRRRNFAALQIDRELRRVNGRWVLIIQDGGTKTGAPYRAAIPEALEPALERYLALHRPMLVQRTGRWHQPAGDALWVSKDGSPMTEIAIYFRITKLTHDAFGRPINPHLLRHALATSVADEAPENIFMVPALLGHRSPKTAERHYNQAQSVSAVRRYHEELAQLQRRGRKVRRA
jgi:site-specific recombinase XerD